MSSGTHVQRLREIRDQIAEELERTPWHEWQTAADEQVRQFPKLAELAAEATPPTDARTSSVDAD